MKSSLLKLTSIFMRLGFLVVSLWAVMQTPTLAAEPPPNIILILADDVGAETIGVYGGESYPTPHIDQLANDGVRFNYGHAQPLCTPSRVKIMTGQHNFRNYTHFEYLDSGETTFAHVLKTAGYHTMVVGKWQLYSNPFEDITGSLPGDAGFDEFRLWQLTPQQKGSRYWAPLLNTNGESTQYDDAQYGPDLFNKYVLDYIGKHADGERPFFIYYPMVLAHDPWVTTPDMRDEGASKQEKFTAMMAYMDKMVGNVRAKVEEAGIAQNTLILFIGDNGTGRSITSRQNGRDVNGAKAKTIDAGTRVPFMAWGAGTAAGTVSDSLVNLNDVLPTLAQLAGVALPVAYPNDGLSLVPVMSGVGELTRDTLFIHYEPRWPSGSSERYALNRQYKLYEDGGFYDMLADPLEKRALDVDSLDDGGKQAFLTLEARISSMPGELGFPRRWIPWQFYLAGMGLLFALSLLIWIIGVLRGKLK